MMKKMSFIPLVCFLASIFVSCSSKAPTPVRWDYEKDAILLHFAADRQLNQVRGKAHTLYMVVYQLTDPNMFNQLSEDPDGLFTLLKSKNFDSSVASVKGMVVYPGSDVMHKIDRSQNAKFVGIVAGYSVLAKERIIRLYRIPIGKGQNSGQPGQLNVDLLLSPIQIVDNSH